MSMNGSRSRDVYWGYGQMDHVGLILLMLGLWMAYDYIVIILLYMLYVR